MGLLGGGSCLTCLPFLHPRRHAGRAFQRLPPHIKQCIVDMGVCHYLVLVRDQSGAVWQWDFGPRGGDVHVDLPGSPRRLMQQQCAMEVVPLDGSAKAEMRGSPGVQGEIREQRLTELPHDMPLVHIGTTKLTATQIRAFSTCRPTSYRLNDNDCRHFANAMVEHMTGNSRGTALFLREHYRRRIEAEGAHRHLHRPLVEAMQFLTDVGNWQEVRSFGMPTAFATMTAAFAMRGLPRHLAAQLPAAAASHIKALQAQRILPAALSGRGAAARARAGMLLASTGRRARQSLSHVAASAMVTRLQVSSLVVPALGAAGAATTTAHGGRGGGDVGEAAWKQASRGDGAGGAGPVPGSSGRWPEAASLALNLPVFAWMHLEPSHKACSARHGTGVAAAGQCSQHTNSFLPPEVRQSTAEHAPASSSTTTSVSMLEQLSSGCRAAMGEVARHARGVAASAAARVVWRRQVTESSMSPLSPTALAGHDEVMHGPQHTLQPRGLAHAPYEAQSALLEAHRPERSCIGMQSRGSHARGARFVARGGSPKGHAMLRRQCSTVHAMHSGASGMLGNAVAAAAAGTFQMPPRLLL
mmetsp:Transcript_35712/g.105555  ORF Transcript_35712/g.105555 Transcript_35712/m.105555 type:complete len:584 (-) Transcript_35712:523-2274(-)